MHHPVRARSRHPILTGLAVLALTAAPLLSGGSAAASGGAPAAAPTGPVTAAVPGLRTIDASTASNSTSPKVATAFCPAGTTVIGTAARTGGIIGAPSNNQVVLEGVVPFSNSVSAQASEDEDGFAGNWSLTATAICAAPLPGLVRISNSTASDSTARKGKGGSCPPGTQLIGLGGAIIGGSSGQVRLETLGATLFGPNAVAAEDETGVSGNWSLQVHGICASPLPGAQLVQVTTAAGSEPRVRSSTLCPPGKRATGVGAFVTVLSGPFGQVGLESLIPTPFVDANLPPTGHVAYASEDQTGNPGSWTFTSQLLCANA